MILKEENGYRYSLIGFKDKKWFETELGYLQMRGTEILFSGSKAELLNMPEEFWEKALKYFYYAGPIQRARFWKVYSEENESSDDLIDSVLSLFEKEPGEYYIIIKDTI